MYILLEIKKNWIMVFLIQKLIFMCIFAHLEQIEP